MAGSDATQRPELLVVAHFAADDKGIEDRLKSLPSKVGARHGGRVAVQLRQEVSTDGVRSRGRGAAGGLRERERDDRDGGAAGGGVREGVLPVFRLMRAGLAIDEYHARGDVSYEEELGKRVDAALSLSRPEDSSTLKELWSPDAAGGDYRDEMAVATYVVQVTSNVARELQEELCRRGAISKTDSSPVTVADFSVQAIVLGVLSRYFPDHGFIAEETSAVLRQDPASLASVLEVVNRVLCEELTEAELCAAIDLGSRGHGKHERGRSGRCGRTWVLDPIDGTKGFLRGEQFCVALGLLDGGKAVAGILGCPNLTSDDEGAAHPEQGLSGEEEAAKSRGLLYTAALREGAFVRALSAGVDDTTRIMVDHARRPCETRVLESVEAAHTSHAVAARACSDLNIELPHIRVDGQCKYGLLSQGQGGIYLRLPRWGYVENIWDHVAGAVVIREAGGKVTDSRGEPLDFSLGSKLPREVVGIVATSGKIHADVLRAVHNRQLEDWAGVVAEAKSKGWSSGDTAPPLPGVDWSSWTADGSVGEEWWATALEQRQPLAMRTSEQFYGTLERGWDKLVVVLFHGSWTQESQHAVGILESLASRQTQPSQAQPQSRPEKPKQQQQKQHYGSSSASATSAPLTRARSGTSQPVAVAPAAATTTKTTAGVLKAKTGSTDANAETETEWDAGKGILQVLLAEADVMSLIEVADRQAIAGLPSLHLHLGGREIVRFPVDQSESADSLGAKIDEVAGRVCEAGERRQQHRENKRRTGVGSATEQ